MTDAVFAKTYHDPQRATAATAHLRWLAGLNSGIRMPQLRSVEPRRLVFEHLGQHHPGPGDVDAIAEALGRLHAVAHTEQLHGAALDQAFTAGGGLVIADFVASRTSLLREWALPVAGRPVAFYKDANIRNFLLTADGVALIDFDDLTLAPFGYDLAKLIVSTAMTYGRIASDDVERALETYNIQTGGAGGSVACELDLFTVYCELHHRQTVRYLHRNGYQHAWPDVRPWPQPEALS